MSFDTASTQSTSSTAFTGSGKIIRNVVADLKQPHNELDTVSGTYWIWGLPTGTVTFQYLLGPDYDISEFEVTTSTTATSITAMGTTYSDAYYIGGGLEVTQVDNVPALQGSQTYLILPSHPA